MVETEDILTWSKTYADQKLTKKQKIKAIQDFFGLSKKEAENWLIDMGEI